MSHPKKTETQSSTPQSHGWMAEYADEHSLLEAARKVRDSGYTKTDAFTPFPVHGIDKALGIKPTILPFFVLCGGLTGLTVAFSMEYWMNAIDYPYLISGKPMASWPAFVPVAFELTILFSAITTLVGMLALNGLPKFSNPVFTSPKFDRATDDRFYLMVDAKDKYYNSATVQKLLSDTQPVSLEEVVEDSTPAAVPQVIWMALVAILILGLLPPAAILRMRAAKSDYPRWHVFFDMDLQPKKKAQQTTTIFADGRSMRQQVQGTVAWGQVAPSDPFELGYDENQPLALRNSAVGAWFTSFSQPPAEEPAPAVEEPVTESQPAAEAEVTEAATEQPPAEKPAELAPAAAAEQTPAPAEAKPQEAAAPVTPAISPAEQQLKDSMSPQPPAVAAAPAEPELPWLTAFPVEPTEKLMALGKTKFETYCAVCHGVGGDGDGLVARRADQLAQGYWIPPTSMHEKRIRDQAVGRIYYTIANGKGKMGAYGDKLSAEERWAVVMYVRALQRSRHAEPSDLPADQKARLNLAAD